MQKKSLREIAQEKANQQNIKGQVPQEQIDQIRDQAQRLSGKSEAELFQEIARLKQSSEIREMIKDNRLDQLAEQLRPMLDAEQQKKLSGILSFLKK